MILVFKTGRACLKYVRTGDKVLEAGVWRNAHKCEYSGSKPKLLFEGRCLVTNAPGLCDLVLKCDSYLVDPASSHMLVSKIKPCMSKYKQICTVKLRMAH